MPDFHPTPWCYQADGVDHYILDANGHEVVSLHDAHYVDWEVVHEGRETSNVHKAVARVARQIVYAVNVITEEKWKDAYAVGFDAARALFEPCRHAAKGVCTHCADEEWLNDDRPTD